MLAVARLIRARSKHIVANSHHEYPIPGVDPRFFAVIGAVEGANNVGCALPLRLWHQLHQLLVYLVQAGHASVESIPLSASGPVNR